MYKISAPTQLIEQVYHALLNAICDGSLAPNARITQENLAEMLGVSRQPILQAFQLLKHQGFIEESGRKGVMVTPLDPHKLLQLAQVRAALDGLAAREAAQRWKQHPDKQALDNLIADGQRAMHSGTMTELIQADLNFHRFLHDASGNPMIAETAALHLHHIRRAMGAILSDDAQVGHIWDEHQAILDAIVNGEAMLAEKLARQHSEQATSELATILMRAQYASKRKPA